MGDDKTLSKGELKYKNELIVLKEVASTKNGRSFLWWLLEDAKIYQSCFSKDTLQMAFDEGCRDRGLKLLRRLNEISPELIYEIAKENRK